MPNTRRNRRSRLFWPTFAVFVVVAAAILIPLAVRFNESRLRLICGIRVKTLGTTAKIYAVDGGGDLAATVQSMVDSGELTPEMAICPVSGKPFLFAPVSTDDLELISPSDVVVYEPLSYHHGEGANILFGDGHASFVSADRYAELVGNWATSNGE